MVLGMDCPLPPGRRARGRRPGVGTHPATGPARGRPGVGTHLGSPWPRYDIHYESPGVPDPPPHRGFRDEYIIPQTPNKPNSINSVFARFNQLESGIWNLKP